MRATTHNSSKGKEGECNSGQTLDASFKLGTENAQVRQTYNYYSDERFGGKEEETRCHLSGVEIEFETLAVANYMFGVVHVDML